MPNFDRRRSTETSFSPTSVVSLTAIADPKDRENEIPHNQHTFNHDDTFAHHTPRKVINHLQERIKYLCKEHDWHLSWPNPESENFTVSLPNLPETNYKPIIVARPRTLSTALSANPAERKQAILALALLAVTRWGNAPLKINGDEQTCAEIRAALVIARQKLPQTTPQTISTSDKTTANTLHTNSGFDHREPSPHHLPSDTIHASHASDNPSGLWQEHTHHMPCTPSAPPLPEHNTFHNSAPYQHNHPSMTYHHIDGIFQPAPSAPAEHLLYSHTTPPYTAPTAEWLAKNNWFNTHPAA